MQQNSFKLMSNNLKKHDNKAFEEISPKTGSFAFYYQNKLHQ